MRAVKAVLTMGLMAFATAANAAPVCQIDEAQQLFGHTPRPDAEIQARLSECLAAGSFDARIFMFQGVMARDHHRLADAASLLETAHRIDPKSANAALELAVTEEWRNRLPVAKSLYSEVLANNPVSIPALLGLARVDRAQRHPADAAGMFQQVLILDPHNTDALEGLAIVQKDGRRSNGVRPAVRNAPVVQPVTQKAAGSARLGGAAVAAPTAVAITAMPRLAPGVAGAQPINSTAPAGLVIPAGAFRYQLDLIGGMTHTPQGTAWSAGSALAVHLDAYNSMELSEVHYTSQLPSAQFINQTLLPTDDVRVGFNHIVPGSYHISVAYDYRAHGSEPTEHWATLNVGGYVYKNFQVFAGVRESFGAAQWNSQLWQAGVISPINDKWEFVTTAYYAQYKIPGFGGSYNLAQNGFAIVGDLNREGPGGSFFNVGVGYSPAVNNIDLHTRWVVPVTEQTALLFSIEHVSINQETQATVGLRYRW